MPSARRLPVRSPFTTAAATRVRNFIERRSVLARGEKVLVAVSGGADSTALLLILHSLAPRLGLQLTAAHFNHRLRSPAETEADRLAAERLCRTLGIPFTHGAGRVAERARRRQESLEEAARNARYAFLGRQAGKAGATAVALGHTLDDRAETVLHHILRGSGLDGLGAMPPRAAWPFGKGPGLARPLLELTREETERYCREAGVAPREDPTNAMLIATRNRIRHELLPALRRFNPRINEALARLADAAVQDAAFLAAAAAEAWSQLARARRREVEIERSGFRRLHPALQVRLIRRAAETLGGDAPSAQQLETAARAAARARSRVPLPGGVLLTVTSDRLCLTRSAARGR